jgi:hypothetical protein
MDRNNERGTAAATAAVLVLIVTVGGHRQLNELKAKHLPRSPDQKLTATPVTSAQAVKAWERALRHSAALLLAEQRKRSAT